MSTNFHTMVLEQFKKQLEQLCLRDTVAPWKTVPSPALAFHFVFDGRQHGLPQDGT